MTVKDRLMETFNPGNVLQYGGLRLGKIAILINIWWRKHCQSCGRETSNRCEVRGRLLCAGCNMDMWPLQVSGQLLLYTRLCGTLRLRELQTGWALSQCHHPEAAAQNSIKKSWNSNSLHCPVCPTPRYSVSDCGYICYFYTEHRQVSDSSGACSLNMTGKCLSWGLDRETVCGTFQPLLNHFEPPMQQNILKLIHMEFCRLHMTADGKTWRSCVAHTAHKLISKCVKIPNRLCHLESALSCGSTKPMQSSVHYIYTH